MKSRIFKILVLLTVIFLLMPSFALARRLRYLDALSVHNIEIDFKDPALELAIRSIIGRPGGSVFALDVAGITELDLSNKGISSIEGIGFFVSLEKLDISKNNISDVGPLEVVVRRGLKEFAIMGNSLIIADIDKLDIWSGSSSDMDLHRQLLIWDFKLVALEGADFICK
jgi:Leucine-rich repeat (LRR) protein